MRFFFKDTDQWQNLRSRHRKAHIVLLRQVDHRPAVPGAARLFVATDGVTYRRIRITVKPDHGAIQSLSAR